MKRITIAIDGFSSCGKSTMAKELARTIGYAYIDSGAMYRAVTLFALRRQLIDENNIRSEELKRHLSDIHIEFRTDTHTGKTETFLNGENVEDEIRTLKVAAFVSKISSIDFVRHFLVRQQQEYGAQAGIVMDGRDIGTVVFPNAELKVFVTASPEIRAERRMLELQAKGESGDFNAVLANIKERDYLDQTRDESPLRQAEDALVLDNSSLTREEQMNWLVQQYNNIISNT